MTRQQRWTRRQIEARRCIRCGEPIQDGNATLRCGTCRRLHALDQRAAREIARQDRSGGKEHEREVPVVRKCDRGLQSSALPEGELGGGERHRVLGPLARLAKSSLQAAVVATSLIMSDRTEAVDTDALLQAIWRAEGGYRASNPFGLKIGRKLTYPSAYAIANRIVLEEVARWNGLSASRRTPDFIDHLASRWCPRSSDPVGHENWKRNVRSIYHELTRSKLGSVRPSDAGSRPKPRRNFGGGVQRLARLERKRDVDRGRLKNADR